MAASLNPESGKVINNKLWLWHDLKVFLRLSHVTWSGSMTWPLIKFKFSHDMSNWSRNSYWKFGGAARRRFTLSQKNAEGVLKNTPRRARVKSPLKKATGHPIVIHQQHSQIVKSYSAPTEPWNWFEQTYATMNSVGRILRHAELRL